MTKRVIAIDPGNTKSALCIIDVETLKPLYTLYAENDEVRKFVKDLKTDEFDYAAIEMMQSYGNLIGKDVLDTAVWIGRFYEVLKRKLGKDPAMVYRKEEAVHLCNTVRNGDKEIRRALIDRFCTHDFRTGRGTIKNPDFFKGFKKDLWAAYAVGLTYIETKMEV